MTHTPEQLKALEENREKTQFDTPEGQKNQSQNIPGANKPWSIRNRLRYLAAQPIDFETPEALDIEITRLRRASKKAGTNTMADAVALRMFEKTVKKMEPALVEKLIDNIEGKLVQPTTEVPPPKQYDTSKMTPEEARAAYNDLCGIGQQ